MKQTAAADSKRGVYSSAVLTFAVVEKKTEKISIMDLETLQEGASVYSDESCLQDDDDAAPHQGKKAEERKQVEQMTLKETRNMRVWKTIVFTFLFVSAAIVSAGTYFFVKKTETEEFEHTVRREEASQDSKLLYLASMAV